MVTKIADLNKLVAKKQSKLELAHEKNAEYLQQVNQLLQEKLNDQRLYTELQLQNSTFKMQLTELRQDYARLQEEGQEERLWSLWW